MDLENLLKLVNAKLGVLKLVQNSSTKVIKDGHPIEVQQMSSLVEGKLKEIYKLKEEIAEQKLIAGEDFDEVESWTTELQDKIEPYKETLNELCELSDAITAKDEEEKVNLAIADERKLHEAKLKLSTEYEEKLSQTKSHLMRVKLPKLEISRFNGSATDFTRFWNTFTEEIDRAELPGTSKFSYLKEYLGPKVRPLVESLPFNTEGYTRAKTILESKYGRTSEIVNAHIQKIMDLPTVNGAHPSKVNEFYETLLKNVQALETMGKLESVNGYVRNVLDCLPGIRSELVRDDDDWHEWKFPDLVESLRKWTQRNPTSTILDRNQRDEDNRRHGGRDRVYQTGDRNSNPIGGTECVYCSSKSHKSFQCDTVSDSSARKKVLSEKKLCFNCTGSQHQAGRCKSKKNCGKCNGRHHTSICDTADSSQPIPPPPANPSRQPLLVSKESTVVYPSVIVQVNGAKCRAVLDTMAGSSYVSAGLLDYIGAKDFRTATRSIEMMFHTVNNKKIKIYDLAIQNCAGTPIMETAFTRVDRNELLHLPNPNYKRLKEQYSHLSPVIMDDTDTKAELPIHIIFGTNAYTHVKTPTAPLVGAPGEPIAEYTRLGWTIMSPGRCDEVTSTFLTRSVSDDYEQLCRLDVLGVQDTPDGDQSAVYDEFCEQLTQQEDGRYESGLLWKPNHSPLANNKEGSCARLSNLIRKHKHSNLKILEEYDGIIREQIAEGMVEIVPPDAIPGKNEFYIPHKPVIREQAQTTKMRIVFDASARANERSPSLNDCLETGPPLQNLMWDVLLRSRFHPIIVAGDMKQAFLQISIRAADRDALRFHWVKDLTNFEPVVLRFARALFGLNQSPFLLGAVVREHLKKFAAKYPELVREIILCLYVDDLIHGTFSVEQAKMFKELSTEIFADGKFTLHKWQSNIPMLEDQKTVGDDDETTYAKKELGGGAQSKLLGMPWDKECDTISVKIPETKNVGETKRCILIFLAAIFDLLGFICPVVLRGKDIYRQACEAKLGWDAKLTGDILNSWKHFLKNLPQIATIRRPLAPYHEKILYVDLHLFTDASKIGTAAVVYTIVTQESGVTQALAAAKSRLSKKTTIPRLELIAALLGAILLSNVRDVLQKIGTGVPIRKVIGWSDSTTALHWINGHGSQKYKQFVSNHCDKIVSKLSEWRHVPGTENPADIASRGSKFCELDDKWWVGPEWLTDEAKWPEKVITESTADTEVEAKLVKEVLRVTVPKESNTIGPLMEKFKFKKAVRVTAWILRFLHNFSKQKEKISGPLSTDEINAATHVWIKRAQREAESDSKFQKHVSQLNLQKNSAGIYVCMGRIQGHYPIYLPTYSIISEKLVANSHLATLHGGVGLTMAHVREHYWIPRLRQLAKKLRKCCFGCKRIHALPLHPPPPGMLPPERTVGSRPFEVIGLDYAGPFSYKISKKKEGKAYLILYTCSLTRAVHLELLPDQSAATFIPSLKAMIARRGRPKRIYSDNFSTFISAAKWLKRVARNEETHDFLASNDIQWRFNLSRAPWWGGQFERMVGIVKDTLYKSIGKSVLTWNELSEVLLDVEICVNNRPLSYVDDDVTMPLLTPNVMMFGEGFRTPEEDVDNIEDNDLRKRARFLRKCKEKVWNRWRTEYLRGLRERHDMSHNGKANNIAVGDVMLIKGDERNRAKWKIGIVDELITGVDGIVRGAILRAGRDHLERAVQFLYPLELHCDRRTEPKSYELNPTVEEFRPKRNAAVVARQRTKEVTELENGYPAVE